ncbi:hypothetical protein JOM56_002746 [Amanita muscaria]
MSKAAQLVLNIFLWVPILPRSLLRNVKIVTYDLEHSGTLGYFHTACQSILMSRVLDQNYIHLEIDIQGASLIIPGGPSLEQKWQPVLLLDSITAIELMLDAARAIQYFHSMGVAPSCALNVSNVFFDLIPRPKIRFRCQWMRLINPCTRSIDERSHYRGVFDLGCFIYEVRLHPTFHFPLSTKHP